MLLQKTQTSKNNLLFSKSNNISSLSNVVNTTEKRRKSNRIFALTIAIMIVCAIVLLSFIISLSIKNNQNQKDVNKLESQLNEINSQIKGIEDSISKKYNLDELETEKETTFNDLQGRSVKLNQNEEDLSIAYKGNDQDYINSFFSIISNNLKTFWSFLN